MRVPKPLRAVCPLLGCCALAAAQSPSRHLVTRPYGTLGSESRLTASVSLGDVDGDGDVDAVVANGRHWAQPNFVFLNDGNGFFRVARRLGEELDTSYRAALADLDGDGDLDVAVGNDRARKQVFLNDGSGHFSLHGTFGGIEPTRNIVLHDLNGDDAVDILVTNRGSRNAIYYNDGRAGFAREEPFGTERDSTIAVAVADLDGNGTPDLALANRDGQPNSLLLGERSVGYGTGRDETRSVAIGDLDGDGLLDLVTANIEERNGVYYGDGRGGFERSVGFGAEDDPSYAVALADLDRNGALDVVIANAGAANRVYFNLNGELVERSFGEAEHVSYGVSVDDLNGDGYPDVVVANSGAPNVVYFNVVSKP